MKEEKEAERKVGGQLFLTIFLAVKLMFAPGPSRSHQSKAGSKGREGEVRKARREDAQEESRTVEEEREEEQTAQLMST